jgi:hypothetical protein
VNRTNGGESYEHVLSSKENELNKFNQFKGMDLRRSNMTVIYDDFFGGMSRVIEIYEKSKMLKKNVVELKLINKNSIWHPRVQKSVISATNISKGLDSDW